MREKMLKWPGVTIAAILLGAVAVLTLLFVVIPDEDLRPEVAESLEMPALRFSEADNAYYYMMGIDAAEGEGPHATGKKIVAAYEKAIAEKVETTFNKDDYYEGERLLMRGDEALVCKPEERNCLEHNSSLGPQLKTLLADNAVLVSRNHRLYQYPHFEEGVTLSAGMPFLSYSTGRNRFLAAEIALHLQQGETSVALDLLKQDISLWRTVLREGRHLISKIIAGVYLKQDYHLLAELIAAHNDRLADHAAQLARMAEPLSAEEVNIGECFQYEFMLMAQGLSTAQESRIFYKPNATINRLYQQHQANSVLAALPPSRFIREYPSVEARDQDGGYSKYNIWDWIYNPVGQVLLGIPAPSYSDYILKVHDLDGYSRLVGLQVQTAVKRVPDADIENFLQKTDTRYFNPYTGQPMQWNAETRSLYFEPMSERFKKQGVVEVQLK